MKKRLAAFFTALFLSVSMFGQGTINFTTRITGGGVDAPVFAIDGITGVGAYGANAQLFQVTGSGAAATYTPLFPATTFRSSPAGAAQLYVIPPATPVVVPGVPAGQQATVVLRAWVGAAYETAFGRGQSTPLTVTLGGDIPGQPPAVPANLVGLQSFPTTIPEPPMMVVGLFGAVVLLCHRRK